MARRSPRHQPQRLSELLLALVWLTRLPVWRVLPDPAPALSVSVWAFPLVGALVGALAACVWSLALWLELTPMLAALLAIAAMILLTGALHEDGLADLADGLGGNNPAQCLDIMRDSRIGSYGVIAIGMVTAARVGALASLPWAEGAMALIAMASLSRAGMAAALWLMPPARRDGLGHAAGRPGGGTVALALVLGGLSILLAMFYDPSQRFDWPVAVLALFLAQLWIARLALKKLRGQTGDVLGAMQQAGEVAGLLALAALL
ncbi:adenosylcobinamide-GDP ribazoletransferase [Paracoccus sulfuroxidans]|uniref:Adenosylcobinamide-GDP ribazoletransferase n=1 Tax=Paracoccus sulfuroxidans TaxID=384678 RepID=A0A562P128_9RHOB|nr:adenosylcobinamide-GDP ribazoletransferase [Paracoccus sulfuroxidans]TWI38192.1 cobalamin-5'-phosphate synthase [Paracoccus sulfuroxidans]